jgi:hypothetical protein
VSTSGDDGKDGKSKETAFATLEKAYKAALLDTTGYNTIVVLTNLSKIGLVELSAIVEDEPIEKLITIKGGAGVPKLTRTPDGDNTSDNNGRVLKVSGGANIKFEKIMINGITSENYFHGALMIEGVAGEEDGIYTLTSRVTLGDGAVITGKKDSDALVEDEENAGSGILVGGGGELVMEHGSKVTGCKMTGSGHVYAPVVVDGSKFTMTGGEISSNKVSKNGPGEFISHGGGVYVSNGEFTMNGGEISSNELVCTNTVDTTLSYDMGGGVFIEDDGNFKMTNGKISGNTITSAAPAAFIIGGGVYVYNGEFTMNGGEISSNELVCTNAVDTNLSYATGGGVFIGNGNFNMTNGKISGNTITSVAQRGEIMGGGVSVYPNAEFTMNGGEISSNKVTNGPGEFFSYGGGVYVEGGSFTMTASRIIDNKVTGNNTIALGGGVYVEGSTTTKFNMINSEIGGNEAKASSDVLSNANFHSHGGGVCLVKKDTVASEIFTMEGGRIYGKDEQNKNIAENGAALSILSDSDNHEPYNYDGDITAYPIP